MAQGWKLSQSPAIRETLAEWWRANRKALGLSLRYHWRLRSGWSAPLGLTVAGAHSNNLPTPMGNWRARGDQKGPIGIWDKMASWSPARSIHLGKIGWEQDRGEGRR